jgi:cell division protein FtsW (lipid II flippase)
MIYYGFIIKTLPLLVLIELIKCFSSKKKDWEKQKGIKIIPLNIAKYITLLALAVLIMELE